MISIFENYFKILVKERINEYNTSLSTFYQGEQKASITLFDNLLSGHTRITKGLIVANDFNFGNPHVVNYIFTRLLQSKKELSKIGVDFFELMRLYDMNDPHKYIKGTKYLHVNWYDFLDVFEIRNKIIHGAENSGLSIRRITSFCSNAMEAMDIASHISRTSEYKDFIDTIEKQRKQLTKLKQEEAIRKSRAKNSP